MAENEIKHINPPAFVTKDQVHDYITILVAKVNLLIDELNVVNANLAVVQKQVGFQKINRVEKD